MVGRVLVLCDDPRQGRAILRLLGPRGLGAELVPVTDPVPTDHRGVLVLRVASDTTAGLTRLAELKIAVPSAPIVLITGEVSADVALAAMEAGACQWLGADRLTERLLPAVRTAMQGVRTLEEASEPTPSGRFERVFDTLVTRAPQMKGVVSAILQAVDSEVPVLVHGETGTGKELVARAIHRKSKRSEGPFLAINCAGIPEPLLEAELFGHERGAYTGAAARRAGVFEQAGGGTLFLDEIGEMHIGLQARLLRVLQSGELRRLGGTETLTADVRIVAATNRDLEELVEQGHFRADLYYRLAVFPILLPPLRERAGDVAHLLIYFMTRISEREGREVPEIEPEVVELLARHEYPGNVRELENIVSYAVLSCRESTITIADLPPAFVRSVARARAATAAEASSPGIETGAFPTLQEVEREHIRKALARADGVRVTAAALLGIGRTTLYRKLSEYGLE